MNNLNNQEGAGDWDPWKYALMVPVLAVGAYRWIWKMECQSEIQKINAKCDEDKSEMEAQHLEAMTTLQLELDREKKNKDFWQVMFFQSNLQRKRENLEVWHQKASATLEELEAQLVERQYVYCSPFLYRDQRLEMEKNMLLKVDKDPIGAGLDLESDLKDIFKEDKHCADMLNSDKRKNGSLMWTYLKNWRKQVEKHKNEEEAKLQGK